MSIRFPSINASSSILVIYSILLDITSTYDVICQDKCPFFFLLLLLPWGAGFIICSAFSGLEFFSSNGIIGFSMHNSDVTYKILFFHIFAETYIVKTYVFICFISPSVVQFHESYNVGLGILYLGFESYRELWFIIFIHFFTLTCTLLYSRIA